MIQAVRAAPQFSSSFSSTSISKPNGEIINNSIYIDSAGNRVVNGDNLKTKPAQTQSLSVVARPDWDEKPASPGAYVADNRGQYKSG